MTRPFARAGAAALAMLVALACASDPAGVWDAYQDAGEAALLAARYRRAGELLTRASAEAAALGPAERARTCLAEARLARELGRVDEARRRLEQAERELAALGPAPTREAAWLRAERGGLALEAADGAAAEAAFRDAVRAGRDAGGEDDESVGWARLGLAEALLQQGRLDEARASALRAARILEGGAMRPAVPSRMLRAHIVLGAIERRRARLEEARTHLLEALRIGSGSLSLEHPWIADALLELARVELDAGDREAARKASRRALAITVARLPPGHWRRLEAEALARVCDADGPA